ncbi:unnamed protein product [Brassicogethes aeneus]|uniref:Uncharacterized protein n=1 Tax=Brassicogethes aeneus TaxID=1431903 RepID=A0A9P0AYT7_BRAAE|nr:unnamed protein product [Brassicogethes aeneus]
MTERLRNPRATYTPDKEKMGSKKTAVVFVVVVGCFAVLWPKVFYPMLVGSANQHIKPSPIDRQSGCCDVISELDIKTIKIMSEICGIINKEENLSNKQMLMKCRSTVLETCGIDISAVLQEQVRLGQSVKHIIDEVRSLNGSLCLKYNFGVAPWKLGVPHRLLANPSIDYEDSFDIDEETADSSVEQFMDIQQEEEEKDMTVEVEFEEKKDLLACYTDSDESKKCLKHKFSHFKSEIKRRWSQARNLLDKFLTNNDSWLNGTFEIPLGTTNRPGPGRPSKTFSDCSDRLKRRKTEEVRTSISGGVILHAAQVILQKERKRHASQVLKDITNEPSSIRQERPPHLRAEIIHPAFRERGRAITQPQSSLLPARPPPRIVSGREDDLSDPDENARNVKDRGKRDRSVSLELQLLGFDEDTPFYNTARKKHKHTTAEPEIIPEKTASTSTISIQQKNSTAKNLHLFTKKKPETGNLYPHMEPDPVFRREVFETQHTAAHPNLREGVSSKLGDLELDHLRRRLRETEEAMERIYAQLANVPLKKVRPFCSPS